MVARCGLLEEVGSPMHGPSPPPTGDHQGTQPIHLTALAPTESWIEAEVDAYSCFIKMLPCQSPTAVPLPAYKHRHVADRARHAVLLYSQPAAPQSDAGNKR